MLAACIILAMFVLVSPMFMNNATRLENSFNNDEEGNGADKYERDISWISQFTGKCIRHYVDHGIANYGPTCKRVEHAHKYLEAGLTQASLQTNEEYGSKKSKRG